jgi:hypothetical protein
MTPITRYIAVTGSRYYDNRAHVFVTLDEMVPHAALLLVGDATGADRLAVAWAESRRRPYRQFRAEWTAFGKAAGPIRNGRMLAIADELIAFTCGAGKGTRNCIDQAEAMGIPVHTVGADGRCV